MYGRSSNNSTTITLVIIGVCLYFFMPKTLNVKVEKSVLIPVVGTLAAV
jgi:hypothetical protein